MDCITCAKLHHMCKVDCKIMPHTHTHGMTTHTHTHTHYPRVGELVDGISLKVEGATRLASVRMVLASFNTANVAE